jgi:hypothetical protein
MSAIVTRPYKPVTVMPGRTLLMVPSEGSSIRLLGIARPRAVCPAQTDHAAAEKSFRGEGDKVKT